MDKGLPLQHSKVDVVPRQVLREPRLMAGCVATDVEALQGSGDGTVAEGLFVKRDLSLAGFAFTLLPQA